MVSIDSNSKNVDLLLDFVHYCDKHPQQRFWQALRNWSGYKYIYVCDDPSGEGEALDTFYWEGKKNFKKL